MFNFKSIKFKFLAYTLSILFVVFLFVTIVLSNIIATLSKNSARSEFKNSADNIAISYSVLNHNLEATMQSLLGVVKADFKKPFTLNKEEIVKVGSINAPAFYNGTNLLNNNFDLLEEYTKKSGAIATIFARMDDDFVRVTTTLKKEDGTRAFGTMLGKKSPALKMMLEGKTFSGKVKLFGKDYVVIYEPIKKDGEVIGIIFIGYEFSKVLSSLKKEIKELSIGEHGYVFMMSNKGELLIHPTHEGRNLFNNQDDDGKYVFQDMIKGENRFVEYVYEGIDKLAYVEHLKEFNAILVVTDTVENIYKNSVNATIMIAMAFILTLVIVSVVLLILSTKIVIKPLKELNKGLEEFFSFLNSEIKSAKLLSIDGEDEYAQMGKKIDDNILKIEKNLKEDNQLINEVKDVVNSVKEGTFNHIIKTTSHNENLEELKKIFNEMLDVTSKNICKDVNQLKNVLTRYRDLDFTHRVKDDSGLVAVGLNELADIINDMLVQNKSTGLKLDKSSKQLLSNVDKLNNSTNSAAASLEETSAALEQITGNIRQNSDNVSKMSSLSQEVLTSANNGQNLANGTTSSMDEINNEVDSITEAITIIDQIAFQTNILSLNAAVEAATAGEAGKGFAVVAQEVRNLATRSAEAAKDIKDLVENAKQKANSGKDIAGKMILGYNELNETISHTIELISNIEMASKEQLQGIEQINDAINSLDKETQENASVANQTRTIAIDNDTLAKSVLQNANSKKFIEN